MIWNIISLSIPTIIILTLGILLVTVEIFLPGFGIPGFAGIALIVLGVVIASDSILEGILLSLGILIILCILLTISIKSAAKGRFGKSKLVLSNAATREEGYTSGRDLNYFVGHEGIALTVLRPSGTVDFNGVRLDVVTQSEFIPKGAKVRVVSVEGRKIVVSIVSGLENNDLTSDS